jgi:hypothetical protein
MLPDKPVDGLTFLKVTTVRKGSAGPKTPLWKISTHARRLGLAAFGSINIGEIGSYPIGA